LWIRDSGAVQLIDKKIMQYAEPRATYHLNI